MSSPEVFPHPPITEAILDIRANLSSDCTLETLATLQESLGGRLPKRRERNRWQAGFRVSESGIPEVVAPAGGVDGYLFLSEDEKTVAQVRLDGFTYNKLKPYDRWETFSADAKRLWELYAGLTKPINVTRVALRYINRIEIPLPLDSFRDYVLTGPEIPLAIPQAISELFLRMVIPDTASACKAIVTETLEPIPNDLSHVPFILDIDVFVEQTFDVQDSDLWNQFEVIRDMRNRIFFGSITEKARELFR